MKKILISIVLVLLSNIGNCQEYETIVDTTKMWVTYQTSSDAPPYCDIGKSFAYKISDSLKLDNCFWYKLWRAEDSLYTNWYINGYIREDNIRIREKTVFSSTVSENVIKKPVLTEFTDLKKRFKTFELNIKSDKIYKNEVLGIFGANALGKTTFARILAGEITPDNGELDKKIKISYKPQYISSDFKGKVEEVVQSKQEFKQKYMEPLELTKLLEKNIPDLSGGELQRVAIASCLAKNADVYLLDEPSAYLDVDQRLAVAKILKTRSENSSVLVIDHDLLFLSYLSDRAMVFTGIPGKIGKAECMSVKDGFNTFLKEVGVTFRKDVETNRPRANKLGSQKDTKQKESGEYYLGS